MPHLAAGALVFYVSAAILVLEIVAGRMLAPYVGVTLETYTGIIGTVLAGIALGNWIGGRLADRLDPRLLLGPLVLLGGLFALLSPIAVTALGQTVRTAGPLAIIGLSAIGFFAPAVALAAVTPTVIKLQLASLTETGRIVGRYSALATTGAIIGTFTTGFLLVAALPSRTIVLGVGVSLTALGLLLSAALIRARRMRATPLALLALLGLGAAALTPDVCDHESPYFCATIVPDPDRPGGRSLILDTLRHSHVDLDDPTYLDVHYMRVFADVIDALTPDDGPLHALHIGGGGFTMPRYLAATRPGSTSAVLELDPSLIDLAERELGLVLGEGIEALAGDARLGIQRVDGGPFDVAIGDAFGGLSVPWHLTTVEFLTLVRAQLGQEGVYVMNIIDHPPLGFVRAAVATAASVFDDVALVATEARLTGSHGGNYVLVASVGALDLESSLTATEQDGAIAALDGAETHGERVGVLLGPALGAFVGDAQVLTDAFAPVDQLLTTRR